jgi:Na+:H+ antiporter, NhaA family
VLALGAAAAILAALATMNMVLRVRKVWPYLLLGTPLWAAVFFSGVHATVAGVLLALTIPLRHTPARPDSPKDSPLHRLEHGLAPWAAFLIVPVFGFANAGVSFAGLSPAALLAPIPLGVAAGLFVGKQVGVFAFGWAAIRSGIADLPANATWRQFYGVALLCGIGFTMSLFIGLLAFDDQAARQDAVKLGVLVGSALSGLLGWALLRFTPPAPPGHDED